MPSLKVQYVPKEVPKVHTRDLAGRCLGITPTQDLRGWSDRAWSFGESPSRCLNGRGNIGADF